MNTPTTSMEVADPILVVWSDGSIDTWTTNPPTPILPAASYGGRTIDTTLFAWWLLAWKGVGPVLVKELDRATIDTVLGGTPTWMQLRRIADGAVYPVPPI